MKTALKTLTAALALATAGGASAMGVVSSTSNITSPSLTITFNDYDNLQATGPLDLTSTVGEVVFTSAPFTRLGATEQDLGQNGLWGARGNPVDGLEPTPTGDGAFLASGFVAKRGELGFSFANPVSSVGAYFNQYQTAAGGNVLLLIAYGADGNAMETLRYTVDTDAYGYNEGVFLSFQRATADIHGFGIVGGSFVMDNLTLAVPEPQTYALLLAGLALVGGVSRRRQVR